MAQILDSTNITGTINKVVELQEGFILNGHYYDKATMTPQPLTFFPMAGRNADIAVSKRISYTYGSGSYTIPTTSKSSILVRDNYDPEITYAFSESCLLTIGINAVRIREKNGTAILEKSRVLIESFFSGIYHPKIVEIVSQTKDYLFVNLHSWGAGGNGYSIMSINKATLEGATIGVMEYKMAKLVADTPEFSYFIVQDISSTVTAKRLNKSTLVLETPTVTAYTGTGSKQASASKGIEVAPGEFLVYTANEISAKTAFNRRIINTNDISLLTCAKKNESPVVLTAKAGLAITDIGGSTSRAVSYELYPTTVNGKMYLNVLVYDPSNIIPATIGLNGIYTYLINPTTYDLQLVSYYIIPGEIAVGLMMDHKQEGIVALTSNSLRYFKFNATSEAWECIYTENKKITSVGFDLDDNIWYQDFNSQIEMISPTTPVKVNISLENASYQYNGVDIDTNIIINATNFTGNKMVCNIKLTVKGSAVFTSTGTNVATFTLPADTDLYIPIKIKDGGQVIIYPELQI